jgi:hypothetical protein
VLARCARGWSLADKSRPLIVARRRVEARESLDIWKSWNSIHRLLRLLILTDAGFRLLRVKNLESGVHEVWLEVWLVESSVISDEFDSLDRTLGTQGVGRVLILPFTCSSVVFGNYIFLASGLPFLGVSIFPSFVFILTGPHCAIHVSSASPLGLMIDSTAIKSMAHHSHIFSLY